MKQRLWENGTLTFFYSLALSDILCITFDVYMDASSLISFKAMRNGNSENEYLVKLVEYKCIYNRSYCRNFGNI